MAVQLPPFQKIVDIPDVAGRHRCAIRGLAIASIVLICTLLFLFVPALISSVATQLYTSFYLLLILGIASMVILFFIVSISSAIALHNTDKWVSSDVCCNLMRSHPARCTRSCSGSKHCCARLSSTHIGASVLASLVCVLFVAALFSGCGEAAASSAHHRHHHHGNNHGEYPDRRLQLNAEDENMLSADYPTTTSTLANYDPYYLPAQTTTNTPTKSEYYSFADYPSARTYHDHGHHHYHHYEYRKSCAAAAAFQIPAIILLISLVATTARSAYLLRKIEQSTAEVAVLPPGKMVTQSEQFLPLVAGHPIDTGNDDKSTMNV